MRLQFKVTFLVIAILLVIGIISGGTLLYFQRKASVAQFEHMALALAGAVQSSLEQSMLLGERSITQATMDHIIGEGMVRKIVLTSADGTITASTDVKDIGKAGAASSSYTQRPAGGAWTSPSPEGELRVTMPVLNNAECQACHSPATTVLGMIEVGLDTHPLDDQTRQQTLSFAAIGALTLFIIGGALAFGLRRTVLNPLTGLAKSAQQMTQGDYAVRMKHDKDDEIGTLARTFNEMAESVDKHSREIESSRQDLARWNTDLEQKVKERTDQLSALNAIITTVSQSLNLEWILNATLTKILLVTDIEAGMVHLLDPKSGQLNIAVHHGLSPEYYQKAARLQMGEAIAGQVALFRELVVVKGSADNRKPGMMAGEKGEFAACIGLPLQSKGKVLGTLSLASYLPEKFTPEAVSLLEAMADAIGIAVDNASAAKRLEEMNQVREQLLGKLLTAQEEERRRIARELHDEASQSLAAIVLHLENIAESLPKKNYSDAKQRLANLKAQATRTLAGIRSLALDLRPSVLDDLGLSKAIDWYAKDYLGKRGISAKVEVTGPRKKLPSNIETVLFRIAQEALTNIVKHAEASQVNVQLKMDDAAARVTVEDNGKGFNVEAALNSLSGQQSLGLHGMLERATLLGGTLDIKSQPGRGTRLTVEIPLAEGDRLHEQDKRVFSR